MLFFCSFCRTKVGARFQNFLNLFSSNFFFARANSSDSQQSARAIQKSKSTLEHTERKSRPRFLFAHARVHSHAHTHTHTFTDNRFCDGGASLPKKRKIFLFSSSKFSLSYPGEKKFEKRCPRVRPDETRPRPIRRNKSWSN